MGLADRGGGGVPVCSGVAPYAAPRVRLQLGRNGSGDDAFATEDVDAPRLKPLELGARGGGNAASRDEENRCAERRGRGSTGQRVGEVTAGGDECDTDARGESGSADGGGRGVSVLPPKSINGGLGVGR